jgi:hypothetical protein
MAALGSFEPCGQQSLATAQVEHACPSRQQTKFKDCAIHRIDAQLAAGEVIGEMSGVAIRLAGRIEQGGGQGDF